MGNRNDLLADCLLSILKRISKNNLQLEKYAWFRTNDGVIIPINGVYNSIFSEDTGDVLIEMIFWTKDCSKVAKESTAYLKLLFSLQVHIPFFTKAVIEDIASDFYWKLSKVRKDEITVPREICE